MDLSPDALVESWRSCSGQERDRAGTALLERYEKVVRGVVRDEASSYGVIVRDGRERHALGTDLLAAIFEAAASYDPGRSNGDGDGFEHWVRYTVRHQLADLGGISGPIRVPDSWQRVGRIAAKVSDTLTHDLRRPPSLEEVRQGTLAHATKWAKDRLVEAGTTGSLDELAQAKLRKQGTLGAIGHLEQVLAIRQGADVLDESVVEYGSVAPDEYEPSLPTALLEMLDVDERFVVECRFGLRDGREWTFEEIAATLGRPWPEVRRLVACALAKPRLPHAHYAYRVGVSVHAAVEDDPLVRLRGRRAAGEPLTS